MTKSGLVAFKGGGVYPGISFCPTSETRGEIKTIDAKRLIEAKCKTIRIESIAGWEELSLPYMEMESHPCDPGAD